MIKNKSWKNISKKNGELIKKRLLSLGGIEKEVKGNTEEWKIKISDSEFIFYLSEKKSTLYCNGSRINDPIIKEIYAYIDDLIGSNFVSSTKKYVIGLDESGKGELVGHIILSGVFIPSEILKELEETIRVADTKNKRTFEYWDEIFMNIDKFKNKGLNFIIEKIPPWVVDKYNINKIIDITYQRILNQFLRSVNNFSGVRIVLDNYGIGDSLRRFLIFLEKQGAEVVVFHKADDKYLEAKISSLISKREREAVIYAINNNEKFMINGISVGSGNAGNPQTKQWLDEWHKTGKPWPWFIKKSYKTIRELDGISANKKLIPPINENLLSKEFLENFNNGKLSIESLYIVCPYCGSNLKSVKFAIFKRDNKEISTIKCSSCNQLIENADFTLRYYCGYIIPDANAMSRQVISKDLEKQKFFIDFKILLSSVVRIEIDGTRGGKKELEKLKIFANKNMIKLENIGEIKDISHLSSSERDEEIINQCKENNAILLSGDKSMVTFALSKDIFIIDIS